MPRPIVPALRAARAAGAKTYTTGVPCMRGHSGPRYVTTSQCLECTKQIAKERAAQRKAWQPTEPLTVGQQLAALLTDGPPLSFAELLTKTGRSAPSLRHGIERGIAAGHLHPWGPHRARCYHSTPQPAHEAPPTVPADEVVRAYLRERGATTAATILADTGVSWTTLYATARKHHDVVRLGRGAAAVFHLSEVPGPNLWLGLVR